MSQNDYHCSLFIVLPPDEDFLRERLGWLNYTEEGGHPISAVSQISDKGMYTVRNYPPPSCDLQSRWWGAVRRRNAGAEHELWLQHSQHIPAFINTRHIYTALEARPMQWCAMCHVAQDGRAAALSSGLRTKYLEENLCTRWWYSVEHWEGAQVIVNSFICTCTYFQCSTLCIIFLLNNWFRVWLW